MDGWRRKKNKIEAILNSVEIEVLVEIGKTQGRVEKHTGGDREIHRG